MIKTARLNVQSHANFLLTGLTMCLATLLGTPSHADSLFLEDEFIVNDPAGSDSHPSADTNRAGTSVVAWECTQPGVEVCARRLSLNGVPLGSEFIVNQNRSGSQGAVDVAVDDDGNFFVVWESNGGEDGDSYTVLGRLYDHRGVAQTGDVILNTLTASQQRAPAVAWQPSGGWVVTWQSSHAFPPRVMVRRVSQGGAPVGVERWVSRNPSGINIENGSNINAAIDVDADGNFVIAWQGPRVVNIIGGSEVFARRYDASANPRGDSFRVVTVAEDQKKDPSVGVRDDGAFVIVFARGDDEIGARRYRANGTPIGPEFRVNQRPASPVEPTVAALPDRGFLVTWTAAQGVVTPGRFAVVQRQFAANGVARENEQTVTPLGSRPVVAVDAAGDALVSFHGAGPNAGVRFSQTRAVCEESDTAVCAQAGRIKLEVAWETQQGDSGVGTGALLTTETSTFWFFEASNIELAVKVLDACGFTQSFWVFGAGATDVAVDLAVTDVQAGIRRRWYNPVGQPFETVRDTAAFLCDPAAAQSPSLSGGGADLELRTRPEAMPTRPERSEPVKVDGASGQTTSCTADTTTLCLAGERFAVTVDYRDQNGPGSGTAVPLSGDSGYYWFFGPGNIEILVKVLDACGFANRFWVLAAGLTDLELNVRVRDTVSGQSRVYSNQAGSGFRPVIDTGAFATCS